MISLRNTAIAFRGKSKGDLKRSYWLFKAISYGSLVKLGEKFVNLAFKLHLPINGLIKNTVFRQFCGGEDMTECQQTVQTLGSYKIGSILDYSVEGKEREMDFDDTAAEIIKTIGLAKGNPQIPFAVFKPSGVGNPLIYEKISAKATLTASEAESWEHIKCRVDEICRKAWENGVQLLIDAEESWTQEAIDTLVHEMMNRYNKERCLIYNTAQMYRKDRLDYLTKAIDEALVKKYYFGIKLVRGAYMEKERERATKMEYPSPINDTKEDTDKLYDQALELCIRHVDKVSVCAGTHNEASAMLLIKLMQENNIPFDHPHVWFSQLLGMSDHISYNIADAGYRVTKYVPYGPIKNVLPYLIRRAQENTSVKGQTGRELDLIIAERKRRANSAIIKVKQ